MPLSGWALERHGTCRNVWVTRAGWDILRARALTIAFKASVFAELIRASLRLLLKPEPQRKSSPPATTAPN